MPVVYGVQSLIDWTWFIQAPTAMALIGGRLHRRARAARRRRAAARADASARAVRTASGSRAPWPRSARRLLLAWTIWQPEASDRATNEALALCGRAQVRRGDRRRPRTRSELNPLTPDPLLVRAAIDTAANRVADAQENLERAVIRFPGDPQTWYRLAAFQLGTLDSPEQALETLKGALYLNPHSGPRAQAVPRRPRARSARRPARPSRTVNE